jgi:DNA-binding NarL/FixJ family response regulator
MTRTVLIVDDHPGFRVSARLILEAAGWQVVGEAADGTAALAAAATLRPEVVLVDVNLPDADGFEVAARLTGGPAPPEVVVVSSRDDAVYGPLAADSGARGFLPKDCLSTSALAAMLT